MAKAKTAKMACKKCGPDFTPFNLTKTTLGQEVGFSFVGNVSTTEVYCSKCWAKYPTRPTTVVEAGTGAGAT